jgi:quercetin dioxygenase-like cupin family protein
MSTSETQHASVLEVRPQGPLSSEPLSTTLSKTDGLQVVRLVLVKGKEIPTHQAQGAITVHCLEGKILFKVDGNAHELTPGRLLPVFAARPHSLVALEDSIVLVTKALASPSTTA